MQFSIMKVIYYYSIYSNPQLKQFLNQVRAGRTPGFIKITAVRMYVYVCVCVSAPRAIKNYSSEMKSE